MNLLSLLKIIVLTEAKKKKKCNGELIYSVVNDNYEVKLKSTYHQRVERLGEKSYDELVEIYNEFIENRKSKFAQPPRIGVSDEMIVELFVDKMDEIYSAFKSENPINDQLIFVKRRYDNEDNKKFNYIEVLLVKNENTFCIITSAYSEDGDFLKTKVEEKKSNRVTLEIYERGDIKIIYL